MRKYILLVALMSGAHVSAALAANPVGHYDVEGKSVNSEDTYAGTVDVTQTGGTYHIIWVIGGKTTIGTAIGNNQFLAITYKSGKDTGIALYGSKDADWDGVWTYAGGTTLSTERWVRK